MIFGLQPDPIRKTIATMVLGSVFAAAFMPSLRGEEPTGMELEPIDISSPRTTLENFIKGCEAVYELAKEKDRTPKVRRDIDTQAAAILHCLDLSEVPAYLHRTSGAEAAACIKEILDRVDLPEIESIPGPDEVKPPGSEGYLDYWRIPGTDLVLHRVKSGRREGDYLFSPESIRRAVEQYEYFKDSPYKDGATESFYAWYLTAPGHNVQRAVNLLPGVFRTQIFAGHALWQWLALLIAIALCIAALGLVYAVGRKVSGRLRSSHPFQYAATLLFPISAMLVPLAFNHLIQHEIRVAGRVLSVLSFTSYLVLLMTGMIVINALGTRIAEFIISNPRIHPKGLDAQLIRIVTRVLSIIAALVVFLEGGTYLGIPLSTLLASAGVGGLALALAAQDSLKNFFGSMMIILDKPYRIGERIIVKDYDGVVEEIGLRSTRLRLLNGHAAAIPNEEMARSDIENVGRRQRIRRSGAFMLPLDTPSEKIEEALRIVRSILAEGANSNEEFPPRVFFSEFRPEGFELKFLYWFEPPDYWQSMAHGEQLNFRILKAFEEAGIRLETVQKLRGLDAPLEG